MRWFTIRRAKIDPELRKTFERHGAAIMQAMLANPHSSFRYRGGQQSVQNYQDELLPWLTEEYDKADRKQTWSMTMEIAITLFVGLEVFRDFWR